MKIALVHDWLLAKRGGEKVLKELSSLFPEAPIYTLIYKKKLADSYFSSRKIITSLCQKFPLITKYYRYLLPIYPILIEQFDLRGYDVIISTHHCVAKGVIVPQETTHFSYCFTPMRYIWDQYWQYFPTKRLFHFLTKSLIFNYLRIWDVISANRVDKFIAISEFVAKRIKKYYGRTAEIIYPPVDIDFFTPSNKEGNFYLIVSALVPYKNITIAIEAFNELKMPLKIIGSGPEKKKLMKMAKENIEFLGWVDDDRLKENYQKCKALILPCEEDFGMVAVEVQACGRPAIVYEKSGAMETIIPDKTGLYFKNSSKNDIIQIIKKFEDMKFSKEEVRNNAEKFSRKIFKERILDLINRYIRK